METTKYAPIAVFTYARLDHTKKMMESLLANEESSNSDLYIFSDGAKNTTKQQDVNCVREYLHTIKGFKSVTIIERQKNWGLANNLIDGISQIIKEKKRVIVIEDDLILSKYFLKFMNDALDKYENEDKVSAISGFVNPVKGELPNTFFLKYFACWGWATWERAWSLFEPDAKKLKNELLQHGNIREFNIDHSMSFMRMLEDQIDGRINSWAIRFYASSFVNDKLILFPGKSITMQNGIDGSGTHSGYGTDYDVELANYPINVDSIEISTDKNSYYAFRDFYIKISNWKGRLKRYLLMLKVMKS